MKMTKKLKSRMNEEGRVKELKGYLELHGGRVDGAALVLLLLSLGLLLGLTWKCKMGWYHIKFLD